MKRYAPWTDEEIEALDERQADLMKHPYTCGKCCESLTPTRAGWECEYCHQYTQNWAHLEDTIKSERDDMLQLLEDRDKEN